MKPRIKICCINSIEQAQIAIEYGASAIGLVGHMPSGPGVIPDEHIRQIVRFAPPAINTFLLTSETTAEGIIDHHRRTATNTIQIVDRVDNDVYQNVRQALPAIKLVQVIHVLGEESIKEAMEVASHVDALLLDSGNPNLHVKELGGTGRTHNWQLSKQICQAVTIPVFLAGGLNSSNVQQAIKTVQPFAVDVCSGVQTNGRLDRIKLDLFVDSIFAQYLK